MRSHPESAALDVLGLPVLVLGVLFALAIAPRYRPATLVVVGAYVLRASAAVLNSFVLPFYGFDADWTFLDRVARTMASGGFGGWIGSFETGREFYAWLAAATYLTVGRSPFLLIALNVLIGTVIVVATFHLARALGAPRRWALVAMLVTAVFPTLVAYCLQPSREPLVTLAFTSAMLFAVRWFRSRRIGDLASCGGGLLLAGLIHSSFVVVLFLAVAFLAIEFVIHHWRSLQAFAAWLVLSVLAFVAVGLVAVTGLGLGKLGSDLRSAASLQRIAAITDKSDIDSRAAYVTPEEVEVGSHAEVLAKLPGRVALFVLKPYPWEARTVDDLVGVVVALTTATAIVAFVARRRHGRPVVWRFLALVLGIQLLMFSWGTVNYGTATRHKSKFVPVLVAIAALPRRRTGRAVPDAVDVWEPAAPSPSGAATAVLPRTEP